MSVLDKARELGEELYNSPEFVACREAQAAMETDPVSSKLLKELSELEADIRVTMEKPEMSELFLQPKMDRYKKMQADAMQNPLIAAYQQAGATFQKMMDQVNGVISYFLSGETPAESDGCGGDCAHCKGCSTAE